MFKHSQIPNKLYYNRIIYDIIMYRLLDRHYTIKSKSNFQIIKII